MSEPRMRQPHTKVPRQLGHFATQNQLSPLAVLPTHSHACLKKVPFSKSNQIKVNSQHIVFVSYAEEGPEIFAVQLATNQNRLQEMMNEINRRPLSCIVEPPMIGTVCLAQMPGDHTICRAIVTELLGSQCKLFFVDFGHSKMVSYYDIFDIPEEFLEPNVFAMRFCLSGVKKLEKGLHLNETFKQLVSGNILTLKVVSPEGPPLLQYGELYIDNRNVLEVLMANMKNKLHFRLMEILPLGAKLSVYVSNVDSFTKIYVQLLNEIDKLTAVMDAVKVHCENSTSPGELPVGAACCARFPDDDNWYRARILDTKGTKVVVSYVDYGNEQEIEVSDLRTITADLVNLPAQALKCALKDFECRPVESTMMNQLEMLALGKTLIATIDGFLFSDTMLVTLVDDTFSPPLDVARKINQISQWPRSSHEAKETTTVRKDALGTFSFPEEGQSDDGRRSSFRREMSVEEERSNRAPTEDNSDFAQRGGSFRSSDQFNHPEEREEGRENRPPRENPDRLECNDWAPEISDIPRNPAERSYFLRAGLASPFKPRRKFTQVQYKELPDPIAPDTPFAEPTIGAKHEVSVTWIVSPESFFAQIVSLQPQFLEMMHRIPELYKGVKPYTAELPVGATVLARYPADGVLYRATVVSVQPFSKYIVCYVDFGNKQLVDVRDIWQLDRSLLELPRMAIHCSLIGVAPNDGKWKADSGIDLCFTASRFQCVFQECAEGVHKVSLWNNGVSVADTLVEKQLAKLSEHQPSVTLKGTPEPLTTFDVNGVCAAKSADGNWYGNTDVLYNKLGLIKTMPESLNAIERYCVRACVNAVPTGTGEWSEAATESFTELIGAQSAPVDALIVLNDVTTCVDIYVGGENITDKLVAEGHARRPEEVEYGDFPSCFATHVISPSEFWLQLESATTELQVIEEAMVDAENFPELKEKEEGVVCAAKYPEDGAWYRAQVIVYGSEYTEVLFTDYGNTCITNELRSLPDDLKIKPAFSRKCALQKPRDIKTWSQRSEEKFNELAAEGATIFNVQFIASGDISIVELYLDGKSTTEMLVELCEEQVVAISERPSPVEQDLQSIGKICYVQSVNEFYVYLESASSDFTKVTEALYNAAEFEFIPELKVGTVCAALWSEDGQWYRARILELCDVGHHVLFIDYGNKDKCEEFRQLPEELAVIETLAKCCQLFGMPEDSVFQENSRAKLDELSLEDETLQIEFLDSSKEPLLVKIVVGDMDVLSLISENFPEKDKIDVIPEQTQEVTNTVPETEVVEKVAVYNEKEDFVDAEELNASISVNESLESWLKCVNPSLIFF